MSIEDKEYAQKLLEAVLDIKKLLHEVLKTKNCLDGDELLDNQDMMMLLKINNRTLERYRQKRLINYYQIDGKTYYLKSEVKTFFKEYKKKLLPSSDTLPEK